MTENQTKKKIKKLCTDNGMKLCWKEFKAYCYKLKVLLITIVFLIHLNIMV